MSGKRVIQHACKSFMSGDERYETPTEYIKRRLDSLPVSFMGKILMLEELQKEGLISGPDELLLIFQEVLTRDT